MYFEDLRFGASADDLTLSGGCGGRRSPGGGRGLPLRGHPQPGVSAGRQVNQPFRAALLGPICATRRGAVYSRENPGPPAEGRVPGIDWPSAAGVDGPSRQAASSCSGAARRGGAGRRQPGRTPTPASSSAAPMMGGFGESPSGGSGCRRRRGVCLPGGPKQELRMVEHGPATGAHLMVWPGAASGTCSLGVVERARRAFRSWGWSGHAWPRNRSASDDIKPVSGVGPGGGRPAVREASMQGKLIVSEGTDGSGKSNQSCRYAL